MLGDCLCLCAMMYRINPQHLLWVLDNLAQGKIVNRIQVAPEAAQPAKLALARMLAPSGQAPSMLPADPSPCT